MKEEGEITDEDDDKLFTETSVRAEKELHAYNWTQTRQTDRDSRSAGVKNSLPRLSAKYEPSVPSLMEIPVPASKPDYKTGPLSHGRSASDIQPSNASVVPLMDIPLPALNKMLPDLTANAGSPGRIERSLITSHSNLVTSHLIHSLPSVSLPHSRYPNFRERFRLNPNRQLCSSYGFSDGKGSEIITIEDSSVESTDGEIVDVDLMKDEEDVSDLDELQLRLDALNSAFISNKMYASFGDDIVSLLPSEFSNLQDLTVDPSGGDDDPNVDVSKLGHGDPVTASSSQSDNSQLPCDRHCFSEDFTLTSDCNRQNTRAANLLNVEFQSHPSAESNTIEAVVHGFVATDTQKHRDIDTDRQTHTHSHLQPELDHDVRVSAASSQSDYEEAEMELDSGSDGEKPEADSQPLSAVIPVTDDLNLPQNHSLLLPGVSEQLLIASVIKPHDSVTIPDILSQQKVPSDKSAVVSEEIDIGQTNSSLLYSPMMPSDNNLKQILHDGNTAFHENSCTNLIAPSTSPINFELKTTDSFLPPLFGYELSDDAFTQSAAGINNMAFDDGKIPALMDIKVEPVDSFSSNNVQQQRKVTVDDSMDIKVECLDCFNSHSLLPASMDIKMEPSDTFGSGSLQQQQQTATKDADKKSELLLRAAVLKSLRSKRQQQKSVELDAVPRITRETAKVGRNVSKLQVGVQSSKRTVTPSSGNQLTVKLPVHPQLIIPVETSDSDEQEQSDMTASCHRLSTTGLAGIKNYFGCNEDRCLFSDASFVQKSADHISRNPSICSLVDLPQNETNSDLTIGPRTRTFVQQPSTTSFTHLMPTSSSPLDRFLREMRRATEEPKPQHNSSVEHRAEADSALNYKEKHMTSETASSRQPIHSSSTSILKSVSSHSRTSLAKNPVADSNMGTQASPSTGTRNDSPQKVAVFSLQLLIDSERRKLIQQRIGLTKVKLKVAQKEEQIIVAEKHVKKLCEQLAAAERIAASSKKQLNNLHEEMLSLTQGIEHRQTAISKLETKLQVAGKNLVSSTRKNASDSENVETLSGSLQFSDIRVNRKRHINDVMTSSTAASSALRQKDTVSCKSAADVLEPGTNLTAIRFTSSAAVPAKANMSPKVKKCRRLNATGTYKSEANMALTAKKTELASKEKCSKPEGSEALETSACHTVKSSDSGQQLVSPVLKPHITATNRDMLAKQKGPSEELSVAADTMDVELTVPSDIKLKQILQHYNTSLLKNSSTDSPTPYSHLLISDSLLHFHFPPSKSSPVTSRFLLAYSRSDVAETVDSLQPYHSSLQCFRSYRLSQFYDKESVDVCSETFCHKLDCRVPLCRFDLMGKCLDDSCRLQHRADYSLSDREQLVDLVSYCPSLAGIDSTTPKSMYGSLLDQFIDKFLNETGAHLPHSVHCLRLIDRIQRASGLRYPHAVRMSARVYKLTANRQFYKDNSDFFFSSSDASETLVREPVTDDVRYWMVLDSDQITRLEEAVAHTTADADLWIKLAFAKLNKRKWLASHDECLSYGLNVLSRAVEANPSNSRLWSHYLDLYMERSDADRDVSSLYEQAIEYSPSYEFFWKYLQLPGSDYSTSMDLCRRLRQYLCSPRCLDDVDTQSHHLLEIVLYQAALCTMSGRFKDGLQVIQAIVQSKPSVIWLKLTPCDRIIMWLSFIHLYECRQLPNLLFDPANSNPGPIVRKEPFVVPFRIGKKTRISYQTLLQLFESSFNACDKDVKSEVDTDDVFPSWLGALYRSRVLLEVSCQGWHAGRQLYEEIVHNHPDLVDIWVCLMQLIVSSTIDDTGYVAENLGTLAKDPGTVLQVSQTVPKGAGTVAEESGSLGSSIVTTVAEDSVTVAEDAESLGRSITTIVERALASNPHSVPIYLAGISALIRCLEIDSALSLAERCPISLYEVDNLHPATVDPNLLYCCLLGQPIPLNYQPPTLRTSVSQKYITSQQANLWIGYCLLLDLQGAHDQATETYRLAISCLRGTADMGRLWLAFLRRSASAVMSDQSSWLTSPMNVDKRRRRCRQFVTDIDTALTSLPLRQTLPCSDRGTSDDCIWSAGKATSPLSFADYNYHNEIIQLYVSCLSDTNMVQEMYQKYVHRMPGNVDLALTAVDYMVEHNVVHVGRRISLMVLQSCPRSVPLWFRCLRLSQLSDVDVSRSLYSRATTALPYSAALWKSYVMFEMLNKSRDNVKQVLDKCCRLGVNLQGFVDSLLK